MNKIGISIYPEKSVFEKNKEYLKTASKYGFERVFLNLLTVKDEETLKDFEDIVSTSRNLGMEVLADVSPQVFKDLGVRIEDLKAFYDLGLTGIRLDMGFSGNEESIMSYNPYNLKIELNISSGTKYIDNVMSYLPNKNNIIGCHNFYPHRYSGLSRSHFLQSTKRFKNHNLRTAAFVSSQIATIGPWPVKEGLPTLEEHRNLPIEVQAKDLFNTRLIDDVIVSNCYPSDEELRAIGEIDRNILVLNIELHKDISETEEKILLKELHFNRGDVSEYMIRSTQSRVKYRGHHFQLINPKDIEKGDIIIESSLYEHYTGEMQIALQSMKNSGRSSVVGKIVDEEIFLLDKIKPWQKFRLKEKN